MRIWLFFVLMLGALASPDLGQGPSSVIATALGTGGVPSPPGYPLLAMISQIALQIPWGTQLLRMNLLNLVIAATCLFVIFRCAEKILPVDLPRNLRLGLAFLSVGLCLRSDAFVRNALWFDRYALASLVYITTLACIWFRPFRNRPVLEWTVVGLGVGLCAAAHLGFIVLPVLVLVWQWPLRPWENRVRFALPSVVIGFFAGLSVFLILPILSRNHGFLDWGGTEDFGGFLRHVRREEYGPFPYARDIAQVKDAMKLMTRIFWEQLHLALVPIALGLWGFSRSYRGVWLAVIYLTLAVGLMIYFPQVPGAAFYPEYQFWLQKNYALTGVLFLAVFFPLGLVYAVRALRGSERHLLAATIAVAFVLFPLGVREVLLMRGAPAPSREIVDFVEKTLPQQGLLITPIDSIYFPLVHAQVVQKRFPQAIILHPSMFARPWFLRRLVLFYGHWPAFQVPELRAYLEYAQPIQYERDFFLRGETIVKYYSALRAVIAAHDALGAPVLVYDIPDHGLTLINFLNDFKGIPRGPYLQYSKSSMQVEMDFPFSQQIEEFADRLSKGDRRKSSLWAWMYAQDMKMKLIRQRNFYRELSPGASTEAERLAAKF